MPLNTSIDDNAPPVKITVGDGKDGKALGRDHTVDLYVSFDSRFFTYNGDDKGGVYLKKYGAVHFKRAQCSANGTAFTIDLPRNDKVGKAYVVATALDRDTGEAKGDSREFTVKGAKAKATAKRRSKRKTRRKP